MFCVCVVFLKKPYQLTLQYLGLSVINPLYTLPLQQILKTVCTSYQPPPMEEQCFLDMLSSFSVGILPEGIAIVGAFPSLYGSS